MSPAQLKVTLLKMLAELQPFEEYDFRSIEAWAAQAHLGAAAFNLVKDSHFQYPIWQEQFYANVFRQTVQKILFFEVAQVLHAKGIEITLLKGAAISPLIWAEPYLRYQADIDILVKREALQTVSDHMHKAGFKFKKPEAVGQFFADLPPTNKEGQLEMFSPKHHDATIEVHTEVFLGHVQRITGSRQENRLWQQRVSAVWDNEAHNIPFWRLANEDLILHALVHTAINHQFDEDVHRNLIDLIRLSHQLTIDWDKLADQTAQMRVQTAVWIVLSVMQDIFGTTQFDTLMDKLTVGRVRKRILKRLVKSEDLVEFNLFHKTRWRYVLLLLMVDRPIDMLHLLMQLPKIA